MKIIHSKVWSGSAGAGVGGALGAVLAPFAAQYGVPPEATVALVSAVVSFASGWIKTERIG